MIKLILEFLHALFRKSIRVRAVFPCPALPDGRRGTITSRYKDQNPSRPTHNGDDYFYPRVSPEEPGSHKKWTVPSGTMAIAARSGRVTRAGWIRTGYRCWVEHDDGYQSGYFHLSDLAIHPGSKVQVGQSLGTIGSDPKAPGLPHLHFEVSVAGKYSPVDPWWYLTKKHNAEHYSPTPS